MPKKRNADNLPGDKLLALYQRLTLDGKPHFQADLAEYLRCSPQSVTRMIAIVSRNLGANADIESGLENRRRYYRVVSNSDEGSFGISFEELHFLAICRDIAAPRLPQGVADRINRTLQALALHWGEADNRSLTGAPISFHSKGFIDYSRHSPIIATLQRAIEKRQVCRVVYRAGGRQTSAEYRYAPGRIVAAGGTLYCGGFRLAEGSLLTERPTVFSIHRISEADPTGEYFRFDAAVADVGAFGLAWHEPKRVSVHIDAKAADYVRDRIWSVDQTIEARDDGSIVLTVTTTAENELNAWIGSFCGLARIEPMPPLADLNRSNETGVKT